LTKSIQHKANIKANIKTLTPSEAQHVLDNEWLLHVQGAGTRPQQVRKDHCNPSAKKKLCELFVRKNSGQNIYMTLNCCIEICFQMILLGKSKQELIPKRHSLNIIELANHFYLKHNT
jgi:hypothetical protein